MKPFALVTGASSGIGEQICYSLAKRGFNIILTSRTETKLKTISEKINSKYKVETTYFSCDLADKDGPQNIFNFCESKNYHVDILVNNAGYALPNSFEKNTVEEEEKCIRVLGTSVISLTKLFLRNMLKKGNGKIMIVSSVAAFAPPAAIQVLYGPIKTFMNRFNEALNINYNSKGITSTALCPGYTVTNFHTASGVQDEMDSVPQFLKKSASRIAEEGVIGMLSGKKIIVPTKTWRVIVFLIKIVPQFIFDFLSGILAPGRYDN
jgi:short-subunit dehydrogenase